MFICRPTSIHKARRVPHREQDTEGSESELEESESSEEEEEVLEDENMMHKLNHQVRNVQGGEGEGASAAQRAGQRRGVSEFEERKSSE